MINTDMRTYDYFTLGSRDSYGQPAISQQPQGQVKMAINVISTAIQENAIYREAQYIGLTNEPIDDTYIIQYGEKERLKVLYVNPKGRYKQVFLKNM